jgi:hypothetical protein
VAFSRAKSWDGIKVKVEEENTEYGTFYGMRFCDFCFII